MPSYQHPQVGSPLPTCTALLVPHPADNQVYFIKSAFSLVDKKDSLTDQPIKGQLHYIGFVAEAAYNCNAQRLEAGDGGECQQLSNIIKKRLMEDLWSPDIQQRSWFDIHYLGFWAIAFKRMQTAMLSKHMLVRGGRVLAPALAACRGWARTGKERGCWLAGTDGGGAGQAAAFWVSAAVQAGGGHLQLRSGQPSNHRLTQLCPVTACAHVHCVLFGDATHVRPCSRTKCSCNAPMLLIPLHP